MAQLRREILQSTIKYSPVQRNIVYEGKSKSKGTSKKKGTIIVSI
jgi:hypothetical protein